MKTWGTRVSRGSWLRIVSVALWAAFAIGLQSALPARQDPVSLPSTPPIGIKIEAQPLRATVGDPIRIDLDFALPPGFQIQFPSLPDQLGEFTVLGTIPGPDVPPDQAVTKSTPAPQAASEQETGVRHHRARIMVAVYRTGEFEFPALPITVRDAESKQQEISTPTLKIRIESVLTEADPLLKDLKKQAEIEAPIRWWLWLVLGGIAAVLLGLAWYGMKRRRRPALVPTAQPDADPLDLAEAELKDLLGLGLLEKGLVKQYYVRISEIAKKALEAGYGIQTVEKTTSEIIDALVTEPETGAEPPTPVAVELIETLLLSCDWVKFARYLPSRQESEEAADRAFHVLSECRMRRMPTAPAVAPVAGDS